MPSMKLAIAIPPLSVPSQNAIKCNTMVEMTFIHSNIDGSEKKATRQTLKNCS